MTSPGIFQASLYLDASYPLDFNFPENHRFRSRGTTPRVNEFSPNMGLLYVGKEALTTSRWGMEFGLQADYDTKEFALGQDRPLVGGADTLRHVGYANVSYLAPLGRGLTVTAGLFDSFIGYESLYAIKNPNYSRSWIADNSPYKMFGLFARYPATDTLTFGVGVLNGYWHLAHPNDLPSYAVHLNWKASRRFTVTENVYYGPDQANTELQFWRLFSNSIVQWEGDSATIAFSYDIGTEDMVERAGSPRTFWTGAALFTRWQINGSWSVAVRPEVYWDRNGRQTGFEQFVKAMTTTVEYKIPVTFSNTLIRVEYRYDESTGQEGGFFRGGEIRPGVIGLSREQHVIFFAFLWRLGPR